MRTRHRANRLLMLTLAFVVAFLATFSLVKGGEATFAQDNSSDAQPAQEHYVILDDDGEAVTVRTDARTVGEVLKRAGIQLSESDVVNPGLSTPIDVDDFTISIWRARPVLIRDGMFEQYLMTTELDAREIVIKTGRELYEEDEVAEIFDYSFLETGPAYVYDVTRNHVEEKEVLEESADLASKLNVSPLTARRGVNKYEVTIDGRTVERKETYYDLPMGGVMAIGARECGSEPRYMIREDGVKVDMEGYVLVAADLSLYPRCTIVETSLGLGKVYDTGSFALSNPEQFDLATDWTNRNGK